MSPGLFRQTLSCAYEGFQVPLWYFLSSVVTFQKVADILMPVTVFGLTVYLILPFPEALGRSLFLCTLLLLMCFCAVRFYRDPSRCLFSYIVDSHGCGLSAHCFSEVLIAWFFCCPLMFLVLNFCFLLFLVLLLGFS